MRQGEQGAERNDAGRLALRATEPVARPHRQADDLAEVAHDVRNMVTALGLYCDLLQQPGVLTEAYRHYGNELNLVAIASRRLAEKLALLDAAGAAGAPLLPSPLGGPGKKPVKSAFDPPLRGAQKRPAQFWDTISGIPIDNLAAELSANRNLLAALAGPGVTLTVHTEDGTLPVHLTGEDLTRVLVNLVKNAAEAMPAGGKIEVRLRRGHPLSGAEQALLLTLDDTGPGIPPHALDSIFAAGFSTKARSSIDSGWPASHRGLGLSITRSIVEAAGGTITAANRHPAGARFTLQLPVRSG